MQDVLFLGNGINRAFNGDSWNNLVEKISKEYESNHLFTVTERFANLPKAVRAKKINSVCSDIISLRIPIRRYDIFTAT